MYGGRHRAAQLAVKPIRRLWICPRCFNSQTRLLAEQQSDTSSESVKSAEKPLSPVEAFRVKYLQPQTQNDPPKQPASPADRFRKDWSKPAAEQPPTEPVPESRLTLNDLAIEYRKHGAPRQYCHEIRLSPKEVEKADNFEMEEPVKIIESNDANDFGMQEPGKIIESNDMNELSQLDEMEEVTETDEIFAGENVRDYQGVLPLNGEQYTPTKFPIKQGDLVETRGYRP